MNLLQFTKRHLLTLLLCSFLSSFLFGMDGDIEMYDPNVTHTHCGICNGTVEVLHKMEEGANYEYSIDFVNYQSSNFFSNLCIGDYIIIVRDANDPGCHGITTIQITYGLPKIQNLDLSCDEEDDIVTFSFSRINVITPFELEYIDPGQVVHNFSGLDNESTIDIVNPIEGDYQIKITDPNGCIAESVINFPNVCGSPNTCDMRVRDFLFECDENFNTSSVKFNVYDATGDVDIYYSTPSGNNYSIPYNSNEIQFEILYVEEGDYIIDIEDEAGCKHIHFQNIKENCFVTSSSQLHKLPEWLIKADQLQEGEISIQLESDNDENKNQTKLDIAIISASGNQYYNEKINLYDVWSSDVQLPSGLYFIIAKSSTGEEQVLRRFVN